MRRADESGATAAEYALILAGVFLVVVPTVTELGRVVDGLLRLVLPGFDGGF